ncbi:MAG: hypothetical protein LBS20_01845 [Prevotella sp.]|nr:hypothetical protein [Prevotella sp.]
MFSPDSKPVYNRMEVSIYSYKPGFFLTIKLDTYSILPLNKESNNDLLLPVPVRYLTGMRFHKFILYGKRSGNMLPSVELSLTIISSKSVKA